MEALLFALVIDWTALASIFTALSVIVTAYMANKKRTTIADTQAAKADEIHVLVNSRLTEALDRIRRLEAALSLKPGDPVPEVSNESKATTG